MLGFRPANQIYVQVGAEGPSSGGRFPSSRFRPHHLIDPWPVALVGVNATLRNFTVPNLATGDDEDGPAAHSYHPGCERGVICF